MKAIIVGSGSVGQRHKNNLFALGINEVAWFCPDGKKRSIREDGLPRFYHSSEVLAFSPDVAFICNPTALHVEVAKFFVSQQIPVYLEKPVGSNLEESLELLRLQQQQKASTPVYVGYQYRFHPTLEMVKEFLDSKKLGKVLAVSAEVGEWLPGFHPEEDYRISYAAKKSLGGGVLLTLSHEIDYLHWLFGKMKSVYCVGGKLSDLEIDVEDTVLINMVSKAEIPIQLRMDFLQRPAKRTLDILGTRGSLHWNYSDSLIFRNRDEDSEELFPLPKDWNRNEMFLKSLNCFLRLASEKVAAFSSLESGVYVMKLIDAAKESMVSGEVVKKIKDE